MFGHIFLAHLMKKFHVTNIFFYVCYSFGQANNVLRMERTTLVQIFPKMDFGLQMLMNVKNYVKIPVLVNIGLGFWIMMVQMVCVIKNIPRDKQFMKIMLYLVQNIVNLHYNRTSCICTTTLTRFIKIGIIKKFY